MSENGEIKVPGFPDLSKCKSAKEAIVQFGVYQNGVNTRIIEELNNRRGLARRVRSLETQNTIVKVVVSALIGLVAFGNQIRRLIGI